MKPFPLFISSEEERTAHGSGIVACTLDPCRLPAPTLLVLCVCAQAMLSRVAGAGPPGHSRTGSSGVSFTDAAAAVKERTREGFSKMVKGLQGWNVEGA